MTASEIIAEYRCPGEDYTISRAVHLARLAAFYPKCRECPHREIQVTRTLPASGSLCAKDGPELRPVLTALLPRTLFTDEGVRGIYLNEITRHTAAGIAGAFASRLWKPDEERRTALLGRPKPADKD